MRKIRARHKSLTNLNTALRTLPLNFSIVNSADRARHESDLCLADATLIAEIPLVRNLKLALCAFITLTIARYACAQAIPEPPTLSPQELQKLALDLRRGGYVLYFRHLDTRLDQEDLQPVGLNDCAKQRNLSNEGIARGKAIAEAFRRLQIPVGNVISSPFCRTMETGKLIGGKATIDMDLFFAISLTKEGKEQKGAALRKLLARMPEKGKNTVIVGHTANLQEAAGLWPKPEGVAYIVRPDGTGNTSFIARIDPDTWRAAAH